MLIQDQQKKLIQEYVLLGKITLSSFVLKRFQSFESSESVSVKGFSVSKLLKYHRFAPPAGQNGAL